MISFKLTQLSYEQSFSLMTAGPLATTQSPNISLQLKNLQRLSPKAIHQFSGGCGSGGRAGRPPTGRSVDPCSLPVTVSEFPPVRVCVQMLDKALRHRKKCLYERVIAQYTSPFTCSSRNFDHFPKIQIEESLF